MDFFINSPYTLSYLDRRFSGVAQTSVISRVRKTKENWIHQEFNCVAFSFILDGEGAYTCDGIMTPVKAPCVFIEQPGFFYEYGPHEQWTEVFIIYGLAEQANLLKSGIYEPERHMWPILDHPAFMRRLLDLSEALEHFEAPGMADRVDRLAELLIIESLQPTAIAPTDELAQTMHRIRDELLQDFSNDPDYDEIALGNGFSPAGFRRAWGKYFMDPPARFVMKHRIHQACYLLSHTELSVQDVARKLHFQDALYFSRKFRMEVGMPPTEYRQFACQPHEAFSDTRISKRAEKNVSTKRG